ncbi:MAG: ion channel protein Tsx, partial [Alcanivorax sp.]
MIMGAGLLLVSGFTSTGAQAEMVWSTFSLSYLRGDHYQVGDDSRRVLTVEHASQHTWGDNFFFLDNLSSDDGTVKNYFELAPRLSLTYVTNKQMSVGIIKD